MDHRPVVHSRPVFFIAAVVWSCLMSCSPGYAAAQPEVLITGDRVIIRADAVDLQEILLAVSRKTGIQIRSPSPGVTEQISCRISEPSLADSLAKLLKNWNYILVYSENTRGPSSPEALWLVGKVSRLPHSMDVAASPGAAPPLDEHIQQVQKDLYDGLFRKDRIQAEPSRQVATGDLSDSAGKSPMHYLPVVGGIKIKAVSRGSSFEKIGLRPGDTVSDVNGQPVSSAQEFIDALKNSFASHSIVRIERYRNNQAIDPIYLEAR